MAHSGSHGETGAVSDGGGIITLDTSCTFTNIPGPGIRTANFAAFGPWPGALSKNAESLRDSVIFFRFCQNYGLYALFQILLSVLQTLQLVLFLCKLRLSSFLFGSKLIEGFQFCHCA